METKNSVQKIDDELQRLDTAIMNINNFVNNEIQRIETAMEASRNRIKNAGARKVAYKRRKDDK